MSLAEQLQSLKNNLEIAEKELASLNAGRKSSAPRLRKSLMDVKKMSHTMRSATTSYARDLPTKPRKPKPAAEPAEPAEPVAVKPRKPKPKAKAVEPDVQA